MKSKLNYKTFQHGKYDFIKVLVYEDDTPDFMTIDIRSRNALYITINGKTIYIELSEATENKFYTSKF